MNMYKLTEKRIAAEAIKHLYKTHLESVIDMLAEEPEQYSSFMEVDAVLRRQKQEFVEMTLDPLMAEIRAALEQALEQLHVQTLSIEVGVEGLKDAKFKLSVPEFDDVPF